MATTEFTLVHVEGFHTKVHIAKRTEVRWSNESATLESVPACGARVNAANLCEPYQGLDAQITCSRCRYKFGLVCYQTEGSL